MAVQLHLKEQSDPAPPSLRAFFSKAVACLHRCDEAATTAATAELAATTLVDETTRTWLRELVLQYLLPKMLRSVDGLTKKALETSALCAGLFAHMPPGSTEGEYRQYISKKKKEMAAEGLKVKNAATELEETASIIAGANLADAIPKDRLKGCEEAKLFCQSLSQSIITHVTWYACLSLFRAPVTGGKSEGGKNNAKQLACLLTTMCGHMELTPLNEKLPLSLFRSLGSEMVTAAPGLQAFFFEVRKRSGCFRFVSSTRFSSMIASSHIMRNFLRSKPPPAKALCPWRRRARNSKGSGQQFQR